MLPHRGSHHLRRLPLAYFVTQLKLTATIAHVGFAVIRNFHDRSPQAERPAPQPSTIAEPRFYLPKFSTERDNFHLRRIGAESAIALSAAHCEAKIIKEERAQCDVLCALVPPHNCSSRPCTHKLGLQRPTCSLSDRIADISGGPSRAS
jgi:hypothetical protein